jgi:predicted glycosyl hydrolase (DUF1957 family)
MSLGQKEKELMDYLHEHVLNPILDSNTASAELKAGIRLTINRMEQRDALGMMSYYWAALKGTERSVGFAARMKQEGFERFEEVLEDFRLRFDDKWLRRK